MQCLFFKTQFKKCFTKENTYNIWKRIKRKNTESAASIKSKNIKNILREEAFEGKMS